MGSEMCIRDRGIFYFQYKRLEPRLHVEQVQDGLGGVFIAAFSICLLYTSDAADERSSVDLGGRRIIKKKKKTIHRNMHNTAQTIKRETEQ